MAIGNRRRTTSYVLSAIAAAGTAGVLAACGSTSGAAGAGGAGPTGGGNMLASRQLSGAGTVLVDQTGKTVYTSDQEDKGTLRCTGSCLSFWFPVTVPSTSAAPTLPSGFSGALGTVKRSDNGEMQVTYDGKPLYTFKLDRGPGQAQGNNFKDDFNGVTFTWKVVSTTAQPGTGPSNAPSPSDTSGGGGGYGVGGY